jgi:flagella basal body P-ring formation protein FlgA
VARIVLCVLTVWATLSSIYSPPSLAANIRLKRQCTPLGAVVLLSDVAEISGADAAEVNTLGDVELIPLPAPGSTHNLPARRVLDLLRARRVNLAQHHFSGSSQVAILVHESAASGRVARGLSTDLVQRADEIVRAAIVQRLHEATGRRETWHVQANLSRAQIRQLAAVNEPVAAEGGIEPWDGAQRFTLRWQTATGPVQLVVQARVSRPVATVVALRSLARGDVLQASDLEFRYDVPGAPGTSRKAPIASIEDVVGWEVIRPVDAGQVLDRSFVDRPLMVRRGEEVTVHARTAGIQARTSARARGDGRLGELVEVESQGDRIKYFARVTGIREVDVYAGSTRTAP